MARERAVAFKASDLREFILHELDGDISRLTKQQQSRFSAWRVQERVWLYTVDEFLLSIGSHLRFFEDWLSEREAED